MKFRIVCLSAFLLLFFDCSGQKTDSIYIKKNQPDTSFNYGRNFAQVSISFFYMGSNKPIKFVTVDIDSIRLGMDLKCGSSVIKAYLTQKDHSISVDFPMFIKSRIFSVPIDLKYDYEITIYLSPTRKSLHDL
jgi:hypothetical protein